jgi:enoyl-CoA hydratase
MDAITYAQEAGLVRLTVTRPAALNALDSATLRELSGHLRRLWDDPSVGALVVTGEGERAFVAGGDVREMAAMTPAEGRDYVRLGHETLDAIDHFPVPVIAAVNGWALGGGFELALACDLIVAADEARFGLPEVNLGILPGFGGTQRLARRIGLARAREMIYLGEPIDAATAGRIGLANRVVPRDALAAEVRELALRIAAKPRVAVKQAKLALAAAQEFGLADGLRLETEAFAAAFATRDRVEGMTAFADRRPPRFRSE